MASLNQQIEERIQSFVAEITALTRHAALEAVQSGLGRVGSGAAAPVRRSAPVAPESAASSRTVGGKRDPNVIERVKAAVLAHVSENPGQGVEQIGRALGRSTAELALPIKKLLAEKSIKSKGQRRGTRYFPR